MAKYDPKLLEEELKNKVAADWFASHFMSDFLKDAVNRTASEGTGVRRGVRHAPYGLQDDVQQRGRGAGRAPYGLQDDVQQRGRDIPVACNKAVSALFSRDRNVASPLISPVARAVLDAGRELWRYYHSQPKANPNASCYDIRKRFQGMKVTAKGKEQMNATSDDACYNELLAALKGAMKTLAAKIEPKVYEYGFLKQ